MSTAHRPTWDPAQAKDVKSGSRQYSSRDMASQTKLKFRQAGQTSVGDVKKRDLRTDLLLAEHEAKNKKRKAAGQDPLPLPAALVALTANATPVAAIENGTAAEEDPAAKRQKMLQEALALDRDDDDDAEDKAKDKGKGKATADDMDVDDDDEEEEDSDDDKDETAQLLAELERIKRERAAEEERKAREISEGKARDMEEEIATRNPLLNLEAALGQGGGSTKPGTFAVKKRWDDDVIFKNQTANSSDGPSGHFVNDLLRTEFHRKFMAKFIK
ncbi:Cwf15/Cwc15 cell cycle control protein [Rhizoctonia solani AG-3 Rhs1AP]|uniref:Cwf15/Cwc15 cell cycle control protein n=1 Tax=Rhizoctonia solani AG-3 Rhs1AP TaxID=1086054 RepID=X8JGL8_9AGAM|nr:Cwf15/Cwc15 cell cycle control protein [Rhizoctonia solani AG-3 Rhs1AP]